MTDPVSMPSMLLKWISALLSHSGRFLLTLAVAVATATAILFAAAHYGVPRAQPWWDEYGLLLLLGTAVVAVFAAFQARAERLDTKLSLIADEQQSFWHHAKQTDGTMLTQFGLRFQAFNMNTDGSIHLSKVRIQRPWLRRNRVVDAMIMTQHPTGNTYSSENGIQPRKRRACSAHIMVRGVVGGEGRKKPMRVTVGVQDHFGRWHKLVFPTLRDPHHPR